MQKIIITHPSDTGQRIDRFCKKYLPNAALGAIYKMLRIGKIKVNTKKKDQTYKIQLDDEITFWLSEEELDSLKRTDNINDKTHILSKKVSLDILYEDQYLMIINKPPGLNVHAGDHKTDESNLIDQVQDYLQGKFDSITFRPALVHRIDRDTSGCIMVAKEKQTLELLLEALQTHKIEKIYHALVFGIPDKSHDVIREKLLRIENAVDEAKVRVDVDGQNAVTHYQLLCEGQLQNERNIFQIGDTKQESTIYYSLLECRIETGRTHQIRVHLAYRNCPIVGDRIYGNKKYNSYLARKKGVHRQLLHARELVFIHPISKKTLHIVAPYHDDFRLLLDYDLQRNVFNNPI